MKQLLQLAGAFALLLGFSCASPLTAQNCAFFSYPVDTICTGGPPLAPDSVTTSGGMWVVQAGLVINPQTGVIDLTQTQPGTYQVEHGVQGSCGTAYTTSLTVLATPEPFFSYPEVICSNGPLVGPDSLTPAGGTFFPGPGLVLAGPNGEIDPSASQPGTLTCTYFIGGACPATFTDSVTVVDVQPISLTYPKVQLVDDPPSYCTTDPLTSPLDSLGPGTFFAPPGLLFSDAAGTIDPAGSAPGIYTVTYTSSGVCPVSASDTIEILETPDPMIVVSPTTGNLLPGPLPANYTLEWTFSGTGPFPPGTDSIVNPQPGTYTLIASNGRCEGMDTLSFAVGIADPASPEIQARVFPNPSSATVRLDLQTLHPGDVEAQLINATGQVIRPSQALRSGVHTLELGDLPSGLYWLRLRQGDQARSLPLLRQ